MSFNIVLSQLSVLVLPVTPEILLPSGTAGLMLKFVSRVTIRCEERKL